MLRSRRRSSRLTGQPLNDERVKRTSTGKPRDSAHDTSARSSRDASRESSCALVDSSSRDSPLDHGADGNTPDTNDKSTFGGAKDQDIVLPLFPNLRASKPKATHDTEDKTHVKTATHKEPVDTPSDEVTTGHLSTKWVKTARGSIRLAIDGPAESKEHKAGKKDGEVKGGQNASFATARRSTGLASMTPDVEDPTVEFEPMSSQPAAKQTRSFPTAISFPDPVSCDEGLESEPVSQDSSALSTPEQDRNTYPTNDEELPTQGHTAQRALKSPEVRNDTSPIPELVADIEKIVQSSPLADRNWANGGTQGTITSTPSETLKKRVHANMMTRTRMLRSSSRSVGGTGKGGEYGGTEQSDSESSQLDGAFDDSVRGGRKKVAQGVRGPVNKSKTGMHRGTKRSAKELSQDEGRVDATRARRRRKPESDGPKPEVDLSSANPIEAAASRTAFSVDDPGVEDLINISEFARMSDQPANAVMLAQMISTDQSRADGAPDTAPADGGSLPGSQSQSPEEDSEKCADCGRQPERYLVCAKCKEAIYCGRYCQLWNWPLHKTRCYTSDEADRVEVDQQEAYLGGMWAAALRMLSEEDIAGGTVKSLLLEEAVRHSPAHPMFMGQGSPRGLVGFDIDALRLAVPDSPSLDRTRAMSIRLAQAAQGSEE